MRVTSLVGSAGKRVKAETEVKNRSLAALPDSLARPRNLVKLGALQMGACGFRAFGRRIAEYPAGEVGAADVYIPEVGVEEMRARSGFGARWERQNGTFEIAVLDNQSSDHQGGPLLAKIVCRATV